MCECARVGESARVQDVGTTRWGRAEAFGRTASVAVPRLGLGCAPCPDAACVDLLQGWYNVCAGDVRCARYVVYNSGTCVFETSELPRTPSSPTKPRGRGADRTEGIRNGTVSRVGFDYRRLKRF